MGGTQKGRKLKNTERSFYQIFLNWVYWKTNRKSKTFFWLWSELWRITWWGRKVLCLIFLVTLDQAENPVTYMMTSKNLDFIFYDFNNIKDMTYQELLIIFSSFI